MEDNDGMFFKDQVFQNEDEARKFLDTFNKRNFCDFVIKTNNKKSLIALCKYGYNRPSESRGVRKNLHYNFVDCKARITMYKSQFAGNTTLKVTQVNTVHSGHVVNEDVYKRLNVNITDEETELIKTLAGGNAKPSQIKKILLEKSKKRVTIQKIKNLVAKIKPKTSDEEDEKVFQEFLAGIEENGGVIEWELDPDQSVKALFITSTKMKSAFRNTNPPVVQLDTSFNFEKAQYKVAAFVYLDPNTSKSEIAAFALMSDETAACFEIILNSFSRVCVRQDLIFLIDKDFTEISTLKNIFPSSTILLCIFHALKYMRCLISTALERQEKKNEMFGQFKKLVYSRTEEVFEKENETFLEMIDKVEVKSGNKYVQFNDYYARNWERSRYMWVKCYRNSLPHLGDNTSNRVESSFGRLKQSILDTFVSIPKTVSAVQHLVQFADERLKDRYLAVTNRVLKIYHPDEKIRKLTEEASKELNDMGCKIFYKSLCRFEEKRYKMEQVSGGVLEVFSDKEEKSYVTNSSSCSCTFFANYQAPCSHIIYIRRLDCMRDSSYQIFDKSIFDTRYHRNKELINVLIDTSSTGVANLPADDEVVSQDDFREAIDCEEDVDENTMTDHQKYKMVMPILVRIANITSVFGTKQFLEHLGDLRIVEKKLRRGSRIYPTTDKTGSGEEYAQKMMDNNNNNGHMEEVGVDAIETYENDALEDTIPQESSQDSGDSNSKFAPLKFKESVKTRGRPKKKNKQVTFNKTALDRAVTNKSPSGTRKKQTIRKGSKKMNPKAKVRKNEVDFIDDELEPECSSSEDEDSGDVVLDDDEDDSIPEESEEENEVRFKEN